MKKTDKTIICGFVNKGKNCSVKGCLCLSKCKTYCFKHYQRFIQTGNPLTTPTGRKRGERQICEVNKCINIVEGNKLCIRHYRQQKRWGKVLERTMFDKNEIIKIGINSKILLYNRRNEIISEALIDTKSVNIIKKYKWGAIKKGKSIYVKTDIRNNKKRSVLYLQQLILGKKTGYQIDHISGNPLDNRRTNLRFVTQQQNLMNKSRALGIWWDKRGWWEAFINKDYKKIHLGRFTDKKEALIARRNGELKYFGEFAPKR